MNAPANVILVGFMGTGKSTVGRRLAQALGWTFVDLDAEIERGAGQAISAIFAGEGEEGFRERETRALQAVLAGTRQVVATGGGVVLRPENRSLLLAQPATVCLHASEEEIWQRVRHDRHRPLLACADPRRALRELLSERKPLYEAFALQVDSSGKLPEALVEEIRTRLGL